MPDRDEMMGRARGAVEEHAAAFGDLADARNAGYGHGYLNAMQLDVDAERTKLLALISEALDWREGCGGCALPDTGEKWETPSVCRACSRAYPDHYTPAAPGEGDTDGE